MKNALRLIIVLSLVWIAVLAILQTVTGPALLDVVLPPRVLAATTVAERQDMADRLKASHRPSLFAWIPPVAILLLGSYALLEANRSHSV